MSRAILLTLLVCLALGLSACGKKGSPGPDLEKGRNDSFPRTYPAS